MGWRKTQAVQIYVARWLPGLHISDTMVIISYAFRYHRAVVSYVKGPEKSTLKFDCYTKR
jgi:hypothetical protein